MAGRMFLDASIDLTRDFCLTRKWEDEMKWRTMGLLNIGGGFVKNREGKDLPSV